MQFCTSHGLYWSSTSKHIVCHSLIGIYRLSVCNIGHVKLSQAKAHTRALAATMLVAAPASALAMIKVLSSSDIVITFTRRRGGSCPPARTGTGQRRTRCKSIRALRPAPRRWRPALSVALLFGTGRHTDQLSPPIHCTGGPSASLKRSPSSVGAGKGSCQS